MRYPLLRLLLRPAMLYGVLLLFSLGVLVMGFDGALRPVQQSPDGTAGIGESARHQHVLNLVSLLLAAGLGFLAGQTAQDLRHCWFSWTLPGLRRDLLGAHAITGIVVSGLLAAGYTAKGGEVPLVPFLAASFLWFSAGAAMEGAAFHFRFHRFSWLNLAVLTGAVIAVDRIAEFSSRHPVFATGLALLGVALYVFHEFRVGASRTKLFVPSFTLLNTVSPEAKQQYVSELNVLNPPSRRIWNVDLFGGSIRNWVRGAEYENYGDARGGWLQRVSLVALFITLLTGAIAFQDGYEMDRSVSQGFEYVYYPLFRAPSDAGPDPSNQPPYFAIYWMVAVAGWALAFGMPLYHRTRAIPLSRSQRARVAYWGSLAQNLGVVLIFGVYFFALGAAAIVFGRLDGDLSSPVFARALAVIAILVPIPQWLALKHRGGCVTSAPQRLGKVIWFAGMALSGMAVTGAGFLLAKWSLGAGLEVLLLLALILLSQWGWRGAIRRHFRTADLV